MAETGQVPVTAGVELGGTKAIALIARGQTILAQQAVPTRAPDETLADLAAILAGWQAEFAPTALGIASFGPIAIDPAAPDYGHMLLTPKPGWTGADIVGALAPAVDGPCGFHTDVTAAALAEARWGAAQGLADHIYITIGTGIGMGIIAGGAPVAGLMHPEAGHIRVRRMAGDDFAGTCPFHGDCLEGLASGPAIQARAGKPGHELAADDPHWLTVIDALAEAFSTLFVTLAPARILLGGGVGVGQPHLLPAIRAAVVEKLGGYLPFVDAQSIEARIAHAALGGQAGPLGAICLAQLALKSAD